MKKSTFNMDSENFTVVGWSLDGKRRVGFQKGAKLGQELVNGEWFLTKTFTEPGVSQMFKWLGE